MPSPSGDGALQDRSDQARQVEITTLSYVDWFNHRRLDEACGDMPPAELKAAYYAHKHRPRPARMTSKASLRIRRVDSMRERKVVSRLWLS